MGEGVCGEELQEQATHLSYRAATRQRLTPQHCSALQRWSASERG